MKNIFISPHPSPRKRQVFPVSLSSDPSFRSMQMGSTGRSRVAAAAAVAVILWWSGAAAGMFPEVEITLANDGQVAVWFMCQMTQKGESLYELAPNSTSRFNFTHVAFPMRWCYLYINPGSHGFFWAYSVRSRCTKCFWSINKHPSLYRNDMGRWERQKLFMPPNFNITHFFQSDTITSKPQSPT